MNRKRLLIMLSCFVMAAGMLSLNGCSAKKTNTTTNNSANKTAKKETKKEDKSDEKALKKSALDIVSSLTDLNGTSVDLIQDTAEYVSIPTEESGLLTAVIEDFDGDKKKELLVVRVADNLGQNVPREIFLNMYEPDGKEYKESANVRLCQYNEIKNKMQLDIFIKKMEDGSFIIGAEDAGYYSLFADGLNWNFYSYNYKDNCFNELYSNEISGSDFYDDELGADGLPSMAKKESSNINAIGFGCDLTENLSEPQIASQDSEVILLATIVNKENADAENLVFNANGETVTWGQRTYTNVYGPLSDK